MSIIYTGLWVESSRAHEYHGLSIAGNNFQEKFLEDLKIIGFPPNNIISIRPVLSYPQQKLFWSNDLNTERTDIVYIPFINFSVLKVLTQGINFTKSFFKSIASRHQNILISYNLSHPQGMFLYFCKFISRSKWVVLLADFPGVSFSHDRSPLRRIAFQLELYFLKRSDAVILLNPNIIVDFSIQLPFIQMLPSPPKKILHRLQKIQPRFSDQCILYYGGRLDQVRGLLSLLEAIKRLPEDSKIELWITGDGPLLIDLLSIQKESHRIKYLGKMATQEEIFEIYEQVDGLVNPHEITSPESRALFPSKVIEQLATGVPVMSTKVSQIDHLFKTSLYFESDHPESILKGMRTFELGDRKKFMSEAQVNKDLIHSNTIFEKQQNDLRLLLSSLESNS